MNRNRSNTSINVHDMFHDMLNESERLDFITAEVSNLSPKEQAHIIIEAFGKMQDYIDVNKMCVEILELNDEDVIVTTYN